MDRLRSGIFLLLVTASARSVPEKEEEIHVNLEPNSTIKVCEGAPVQIDCTFQPSRKYKVSWHFSNQKDFLKCDSDRLKISEGFSFMMQNNNDSWSTLTSMSIRTNESGWYFCRVTRDIPDLKHGCSEGLHVLVEAINVSTSTSLDQTQSQDPNQNQSTTDSPTSCSSTFTAGTSSPPVTRVPFFDLWWIWIVLAVGCAVLIVLVVVKWMLSCRTKETIYENTAPKSSSCWRRNQTRMGGCDLPASKKVETIKPLRKYDTLSQNRIHRS